MHKTRIQLDEILKDSFELCYALSEAVQRYGDSDDAQPTDDTV